MTYRLAREREEQRNAWVAVGTACGPIAAFLPFVRRAAKVSERGPRGEQRPARCQSERICARAQQLSNGRQVRSWRSAADRPRASGSLLDFYFRGNADIPPASGHLRPLDAASGAQ